jgi:hypothetical protein
MSLDDLLKRGLKARRDIWPADKLPSVHIEFLDDRLEAVFDGVSISVPRAEVDPNRVMETVGKSVFQTLCYKVFNEGTPGYPREHIHHNGSWEDAQRMALKIGMKVERLLHTQVWLVMSS